MNEAKKRCIVQQIIYIVSQAVSPAPPAENTRRYKSHWSEDVGFSLVDDAVDKYEDLSRRLLKDEGWSTKFSEGYVNKAINRLLANVIRDGDNTKAAHYFDQLVAEFDDYSQEQIAYVPIIGIQMHIDTLPIGQVVLRRMTEDLKSEIVDKVASITRLSKHSPEEKDQLIQPLRQGILGGLKVPVCAEFHVVAEPERASERAEEETRRVLDLLWYSIPVLYRGLSEEHKPDVELQGAPMSGPRMNIVISSDMSHFLIRNQLLGPLVPFELSEEKIETMKHIGVFEASRILGKSIITDFEGTLLRGIHWFAVSQNQSEAEQKLLSLIICLETFLTPRDSDPISNAIAEGVAILLARDLAVRKHLKSRIKDFYSMRCALSHGGKKAILDADLAELTHIAVALTRLMIKRKEEFAKQRDLLDWIENQKLGAQTAP